jgi:hypothetical protein
VALEHYCFYNAVRRRRNKLQPWGQVLEGLVMIRIHPEARCKQPVQGALAGLLNAVAQYRRLDLLAVLYGAKPLCSQVLIE